ncbi:response regulator transcription factor [Nocardioides montaniterrae]
MTGPIRVLVVDDDFRVADIHTAFVNRSDGFTVVGTAHTAAEAMVMVETTAPDLVLMDVFLPDGDGLEVVRRLLERPAAPDVIVVTAAREVTTVRTAMQLGAVHYLMKPFGFVALDGRLQSYRRMRNRIAGLHDPDQSEVDELFSMLRPTDVGIERPAKGHSAPTLELVRRAVADGGNVSAAEVAEAVGISRSTAHRYLTYLQQHGIVRLEPRYGNTGRPENGYTLTGRRT